jgi:hypothetical protein
LLHTDIPRPTSIFTAVSSKKNVHINRGEMDHKARKSYNKKNNLPEELKNTAAVHNEPRG